VRLFGTDASQARGGPPRERFKRLRNAYSEWRSVDWTRSPWASLGRAVSCQECHMSLYPGVCEPLLTPGEVAPDDSCPPGTRLSARPPGAMPDGPWATNARPPPHAHYLTGVDVPLAPDYAGHVEDADLDASGPAARVRHHRRRQLLRAALRMTSGRGVRRQHAAPARHRERRHRTRPAGFRKRRSGRARGHRRPVASSPGRGSSETDGDVWRPTDPETSSGLVDER
jgi:hypothetical protein